MDWTALAYLLLPVALISLVFGVVLRGRVERPPSGPRQASALTDEIRQHRTAIDHKTPR